jgi:hypothetical protein
MQLPAYTWGAHVNYVTFKKPLKFEACRFVNVGGLW